MKGSLQATCILHFTVFSGLALEPAFLGVVDSHAVTQGSGASEKQTGSYRLSSRALNIKDDSPSKDGGIAGLEYSQEHRQPTQWRCRGDTRMTGRRERLHRKKLTADRSGLGQQMSTEGKARGANGRTTPWYSTVSHGSQPPSGLKCSVRRGPGSDFPLRLASKS